MTALYVHWPFCKKKCPYCDFNSHVRDEVAYDRMGEALLQEMRFMRNMAKSNSVTSIFFGGGTPSLMPPYIVENVINEAAALWSFSDNIEITLEANPTSYEAARFAAYKQAGVNRLSLGVQSLIDAELQFLGREHSAQEALHILQQVQEQFERYSFDLIYARPMQTVASWQKELSEALRYHRDHISLYQLTIEPDTAFARVYAKGGFELPDDDTALALYDITQTICADAGLHRYEVSNYAANGRESTHNMSYWKGEDYIGVGAGAHGRILTHDESWIAVSTYKSPELWLHHVEQNGHAIKEQHIINAKDRAEEILISGLRLTRGIEYSRVESIINKRKYRLFQQEGLVVHSGEYINIAPQHVSVTERIIAELII